MTELSLQRGLAAMREEIDAPVAAFFSSCVNCGLCAQACPFYVETGDPKYTPIRKVEPLRLLWEQEYTLWGKLKATVGIGRKVTDEMLAEWEPLLYDSCTMCGRCSRSHREKSAVALWMENHSSTTFIQPYTNTF